MYRDNNLFFYSCTETKKSEAINDESLHSLLRWYELVRLRLLGNLMIKRRKVSNLGQGMDETSQRSHYSARSYSR